MIADAAPTLGMGIDALEKSAFTVNHFELSAALDGTRSKMWREPFALSSASTGLSRFEFSSVENCTSCRGD